MPFLFLVPAFLAGIAAIAIPIIVHLRRKQRTEVVQFPSLMFLEKIPYQSEERHQIQYWPLLLLRALAVLLLVAAFARPFFDRSREASATSSGPKEIVVLLDRSYSMGIGDRFERAKAAAMEAVQNLGPLDRVSLVLFATTAEARQRSTADQARLRLAVDSAKVGSQGTRYGPALRLAQTILDDTDLPALEVIVISDFQRAGWTGDEDVHFPEGTEVRVVPIGDDKPVDNLSVADVSLPRTRFAGREQIAPSARITRTGGTGPLTVPAVLEMDGREVQSKTVTVPENGSVEVTFEPVVLTERHARGTVRVGEDELPPDNAYNFVVSPGSSLGVVVVGQSAAAGNQATKSVIYLDRALGISEEGGFDVVVRPDVPTEADLRTRGVVILHDTPFPSGASGARLRSWVEQGGGLVIAAGERGSWPREMADLFPGELQGMITGWPASGARLAQLDYGHPIFARFSGPRSGDFTGARFYQARVLNVTPSDSVRILARYSDNHVALAERKVGQGRVLVWTSSLDTWLNDLALQPVFLPYVHEIVRYASGRNEVVPSYTSGQVLDVTDARAMATAGLGDVAGELQGGDRVIIAPSGEALALRGAEGPMYLSLDEQGFYEIRPPQIQTGERSLAVAVNVDLAEADLSPLDPQELQAAVTAEPGQAPRRTAQEVQLRQVDQEARQRLWRWLLLAALVLLVAETAVSNWISRNIGKRGIHA